MFYIDTNLSGMENKTYAKIGCRIPTNNRRGI
jgi:hypothetical protein